MCETKIDKQNVQFHSAPSNNLMLTARSYTPDKRLISMYFLSCSNLSDFYHCDLLVYLPYDGLHLVRLLLFLQNGQREPGHVLHFPHQQML